MKHYITPLYLDYNIKKDFIEQIFVFQEFILVLRK